MSKYLQSHFWVSFILMTYFVAFMGEPLSAASLTRVQAMKMRNQMDETMRLYQVLTNATKTDDGKRELIAIVNKIGSGISLLDSALNRSNNRRLDSATSKYIEGIYSKYLILSADADSIKLLKDVYGHGRSLGLLRAEQEYTPVIFIRKPKEGEDPILKSQKNVIVWEIDKDGRPMEKIIESYVLHRIYALLEESVFEVSNDTKEAFATALRLTKGADPDTLFYVMRWLIKLDNFDIAEAISSHNIVIALHYMTKFQGIRKSDYDYLKYALKVHETTGDETALNNFLKIIEVHRKAGGNSENRKKAVRKFLEDPNNWKEGAREDLKNRVKQLCTECKFTWC